VRRQHDSGPPPAPGIADPWFTLDYSFVKESGEAELPVPSIK
jgi:hypothetical protein